MLNRKIAFLFLIIVTIGCVRTESTTQENLKTDIIIPFEDVEGCDTGKGLCDTVQVTRTSKAGSINLIFPHGGTQAELRLYDRSSYLTSSLAGFDAIPLQVDSTFSYDEGKLPTITLTNLEDGLYCVHMLADAYGGAKWINIKTEK